MSRIDWEFIRKQEGALICRGYVPKGEDGAPLGHSGVTISSGLDLGQQSEADLRRYGLPEKLIIQFYYYLGKKGPLALEAIHNRPLLITPEEARLIEVSVYRSYFNSIAGSYREDTGKSFDELPPQLQTVAASLCLNFGTNLKDRLPETWRLICAQDFDKLYDLLMDFPSDQYYLRHRRQAEAALLRPLCTT